MNYSMDYIRFWRPEPVNRDEFLRPSLGQIVDLHEMIMHMARQKYVRPKEDNEEDKPWEKLSSAFFLDFDPSGGGGPVPSFRISDYFPRGLVYNIPPRSPSNSSSALQISPPPSLAMSNFDPTEASYLLCCRACKGRFEYPLGKGVVTIVAGVPKGVSYKAVSYVWGKTYPLRLSCQNCTSITTVPMQSPAKFHRLMALAGTGNTIWLDAISIDQSDHSDIAAQVAVMGTIYSNATCVSVLLPSSDEEAFSRLRDLSDLAQQLLNRPEHFKWNYEDNDELERVESWDESGVPNIPLAGDLILGRVPRRLRPLYGGATTGSLCKRYYHELELFKDRLDTWQYWRRAWTFQEWALAGDIEITWESDVKFQRIERVKSTIVLAAITITKYKLRAGQYAKIKLGLSRGEVIRNFNTVKRLFPYEHVILYHEELDKEVLKFQTSLPNYGCSQVLGLRSNPRTDDREKFLARLNIMLNAFGSSKREARFDADLVCCWASMCEIDYEYRKDDSLSTALKKVETALRRREIKIFDFVVRSETDLAHSFFDYAKEHIQSNSTNKTEFHGAPIFTGRADTAVHFRNSAMLVNPTYIIADPERPLQEVIGATVGIISELSDVENVLEIFDVLISGAGGNFMFSPLQDEIKQVLLSLPDEASINNVLVFTLISAEDLHLDPEAHGTLMLPAWAICSKEMAKRGLLIVREGMNGTLALVVEEMNIHHLVAFLTISDQQSGTYLIRTDIEGNINLLLETPQRSDMMNDQMMLDRWFRGSIKLRSEPRAEALSLPKSQERKGKGKAANFVRNTQDKLKRFSFKKDKAK
ncbi:uncharacterized protein K444DRAFT_310921 [Hyaloscypha bicolor E]|uniref:Heterokaryon incompatibility domain-containing protein n=1 Tax=Hyaloscypha bicolor E TaxID=1095630 RepID=A0A2J6TLU9_9HELO|nr:uncharacterized protein K444DRAFT_310921 [Hyaloscypha bicolor E]PMD63993.1 hypothetical protein K444DRAFT_310921 [Hyaloscypha bicolor E]